MWSRRHKNSVPYSKVLPITLSAFAAFIFGYSLCLFFVCFVFRLLYLAVCATEIQFSTESYLTSLECSRRRCLQLRTCITVLSMGSNFQLLSWENIPSEHEMLAQCFFLLLGHRHRRWPNIKTTLGECLMFAGFAVLLLKKREILLWTVISNAWPRLFRLIKGLLESATFYLLHRMLKRHAQV